MLEIPGYEILRLYGLSTFQKHVVVRVGTHLYRVRGPNPQGCFPDRLKRSRYDLRAPLKPGTTNDLLIFRIDAAGDAQPD